MPYVRLIGEAAVAGANPLAAGIFPVAGYEAALEVNVALIEEDPLIQP
jgi:hypothetical protein